MRDCLVRLHYFEGAVMGALALLESAVDGWKRELDRRDAAEAQHGR